MKMVSKLLYLVLLAPMLAACGSDDPTPAPTAVPPEALATEVPPESSDPVWERVQAEGKIVFGTSADYQPFEYYDADFEIIGFDPALARELGARLGLDVELVDIAFEGLPAALEIGQIDAAIAAISVTAERQSILDFTNVYYSGQDMILARENSGVEQIVTPAQLAQYRVAVQRGSIYDSWVQDTLVATGLMPETNLLRYARAGDAVRDLLEERSDVVLMDKLPAEEYILAGDVVAVGENLNTQLFAIALPKGASTLQSELNAALVSLQNDGTIARLSDTYLQIELPAQEPEPIPTPTPIPGPTATPAPCLDAMTFVQDVQIPDGSEINANGSFNKVWRIRNTGTCTWDTNYRLVFVQGVRMDGSETAVSTTVNPGDTYDLTLGQRAPNLPGGYTGVWQMVNPNRMPFGERIWVRITVPGNAQPTPLPPTATPVPPVQPTLAPAPVINFLNVSSQTLQQGDLQILSWSFSGESLQTARLTRTNPDGSQTPLFGGADVAMQGEYEDLLMAPGTYSYTLNVTSETGGTTVRTVVFNVTPSVQPPTATPQPPTATPQPTLTAPPVLATATPATPVQPTLSPAPVIDYLEVSSETVELGDLLIVSWSFSGEGLQVATITRTNPDGSETPLFGGADVDTQGEYEDLMMMAGTYVYTLSVSSELGGTTEETVEVTVNSN